MDALFILLGLLSFSLAQQLSIPAQNATAFALEYGYPLIGFERLAQPLIHAVGANSLVNSRVPPDASFRAVVRPNVDTLYSTAIYDLSHNDVVIEVPEVPSDQYALFSYYDPYGDNFANTGTGSGNIMTSGQYRLTKRSAGATEYGIQVEGTVDAEYQATIVSPSTDGILLIRWLLNSTNIEDIYTYQDNTSVRNLTRVDSDTPYLIDLPAPSSSMTPAENVLNLLAAFTTSDEPAVSTASNNVSMNLEAAGIAAGVYSRPDGVDLTQANQTAVQAALQSAAVAGVYLNNGWSLPDPDLIGAYGTNYAFRTAVASVGYLALTSPTALYPSWSNGSGGVPLAGNTFSLGPDESLIYTFSSKPPLQSYGFWSMTAYVGDYLLPNPQNVYALGDRSNLTYADGSRVYYPSSQSRTNTSTPGEQFQILVQPADVAPPANWTSNWLPGPAGGGDMSVLLRWYGAEQSLIDGTYPYPVVTRQSAFRRANATSASSNSTSSTTGGSGRSNSTASASASAMPAPYTGAGTRALANTLLIAGVLVGFAAWNVM